MGKIKQIAKGSNINQSLIINKGNLTLQLDKEALFNLVKDYCSIDTAKIIDLLKKEIEKIPQEFRRFPSKRIFIPLLQQLSYNLDEDYLKNIYLNLLRSSMDAEQQNKVHTSFLYIVSQLCPDEAKILKVIGEQNELVMHPIIDIDIHVENGYISLAKNIAFQGLNECEHPENHCVYYENLLRLNLITIPQGERVIDKEYYKYMENHPTIMKIINNSPHSKNGKIEFKEKGFMLTKLGAEFIKICLS